MMQSLVRASLHRPCSVIVGALAMLVLGVLAAAAIPVDILPVNRTPAVQVLTFYGGMPADAVEKNISSRIERQTGQAAGRIRQESRSILGASVVRNYFHGHVDPNNALTQVSSLATAAAKNLPPGCDPPVILPFDPTGTTPVCVVALDSPAASEAALYDVGRYEVRNMIMGLPGANAPAVHGGRQRAILAYLDRHKLQARNLSPLDVMQAIEDYNLFLPTGDAKFGNTDFAISSNAMFSTVDHLGDIPLRSEAGHAAWLRDVAVPSDASFVQTSLVRVNGRRQVYIPVYRQVGASTLAVVDRLKAAIGDMTDRLTLGGVDLKVVMDQSVYVRHSIRSLIEEGLLGAVMCSLVILLFLGNLRMTGIAILTIPLSLLAAVAGLHATGHTLNVMTLAGMTLAIGPLVDLSVICLENTHRHLERGAATREAALLGTGEVATPALAATCCTLLVLAPLAFLPDLGEFLFRPMALGVALPMIAAFALALTFVPTQCAAWLRMHDRGSMQGAAGRGDGETSAVSSSPPLPSDAGYERRLTALLRMPGGLGTRAFLRIHGGLRRLTDWYLNRLETVLRHPRLTLAVAGLLLAVTVVGLGPRLNREFFPEVDAGAFEMTVRGPSGTRLEATEETIVEVEQALRESVGDDLQLVIAELGVVPDWSAAYTPNSGPMDAVVKVQLTADRNRTAQDHVQALRRRLAGDARFSDWEFGFDAGGLIRAAMNGGRSSPIIVRTTGKDLAKARRVAEAIQAEVVGVPGVADARILQRLDYPQYTIEIDRDRAADLGLPLPHVMKNVIAALNSSIQFNKTNFYFDPLSRNQYYVGVQYPEEDIESVDTLLDIPLTAPAQERVVPLRNVVSLSRSTVAAEVAHHDLQPAVELVMSVEGRDLGRVADDVAAVLARFGARQSDGTWAPYDPEAAPVAEAAGFGSQPDNTTQAGRSPHERETLKGSRIALGGEYARMQEMFRNLGGGLALATLLVYFVLVVLFQSFRLPLVILCAVPLGIVGVVLMLFATGTAINVQSLLGVIFMVGIVTANSVLLVDCARNLNQSEGLPPAVAIRRAAALRMRPVLMTASAALLALLPMALALGRGTEANAPLGRAVIGGLLAGVVTTLFVVPCLYLLLSPGRPNTSTATPR